MCFRRKVYSNDATDIREEEIKFLMKWFRSMDVKPKSPGLYGGNMGGQTKPDSFFLIYWDGEGWKAPTESDTEISPYRGGPMLW